MGLDGPFYVYELSFTLLSNLVGPNLLWLGGFYDHCGAYQMIIFLLGSFGKGRLSSRIFVEIYWELSWASVVGHPLILVITSIFG